MKGISTLKYFFQQFFPFYESNSFCVSKSRTGLHEKAIIIIYACNICIVIYVIYVLYIYIYIYLIIFVL